ncbi:MAG: hypothetical protein J3K34DRAFT_524143 [Monoraphidium minutum]|nr:MAG: hypothetical protein J3K34DRAFT_524143 [Monoraphidium minutum]
MTLAKITVVAACLFAAVVATNAAEAATIKTCKALATALGYKLDGVTLICPTDEEFGEFAETLGLEGPDYTKQLADAARANKDVFKAVLDYHVIKGVLPKSKLKDGMMLTPLLAKAKPYKVVLAKDGSVSLLHPEVEIEPYNPDTRPAAPEAPEEHEDELVVLDRTFEGAFAPGKSKYVVHVVDHVIVPEAAVPGILKAQKAIYEANVKADEAAEKAEEAAAAKAAAAKAAAARTAAPKTMTRTGRRLLVM